MQSQCAGGFVTRNSEYFFVSRDLVDLVSMRTIIDDIPSAAHKSLRLVRRVRRRETNMLV